MCLSNPLACAAAYSLTLLLARSLCRSWIWQHMSVRVCEQMFVAVLPCLCASALLWIFGKQNVLIHACLMLHVVSACCLGRLYIEEEIYAPENQSPPLGEGFALAAIRSKARNYRRAGTDVGEILQASQRLAHAQSERQATACRLLPPVHWALLYTIGALFVSTFILFETGGSFSNEGRHILFTVLCGLMSFVLCVSHQPDSIIIDSQELPSYY